ncbi:hypothetical protein CRE_11838 [Caenorhabditis remanei]|uniref:Serine/threonine specific protein phosphatases domain-containing protein n=1 Tax=Caenorhabditis remanei TaxID=31234 RepID=E3M403_CAERE|nr:hypothetical protein CRE_11838 [Caenorhabditis remanei]
MKIILLLVYLLNLLNITNEVDGNIVPEYENNNNELLCYSKLDKSRVVRCETACVQKTLISRYKIDLEYDFDFYYRIGCESKSLNDKLNEMKCDWNQSNGPDYTIDYMIKGDEIRNPRLFVRKTCCFHAYCNKPKMNSRRYWFQKDQSMLTILRNKYNSRHLLLPVIFALFILLIIYGILTFIMSWWKTKQLAEGGKKCKELELELIQESKFPESIIQDVSGISEFIENSALFQLKLEVTGCLTVRETAFVLSQLPDYDKMKHSRVKSASTEESTKESKTGKTLKITESEVVVEGKTIRKVRNVFLKPALKTNAAGWGHILWNTIRTINSPNDILYRMIEHGPYRYPFTALELLSVFVYFSKKQLFKYKFQLFEETAYRMADEPSLLQIDADITVIGDIRGRYTDLHRWLQLTGWPPENRILFLGGILDRDEPGSIECLALICALKVVEYFYNHFNFLIQCRFPNHVFLLRGEPETSLFRMIERLNPVITRAIQSCIKRMCSHIPFAAIIGKSILAVYSGFSPMIRKKKDIHDLFRPVKLEDMNAVERHIIYNQPSSKVRMYRPNPNSEGDLFGEEAVKRACKSMRCNTMIRGQSHVPFGYLPCWNDRLINLWSAPGYGSNYGAVLYISKELVITPILMEKQLT